MYFFFFKVFLNYVKFKQLKLYSSHFYYSTGIYFFKLQHWGQRLKKFRSRKKWFLFLKLIYFKNYLFNLNKFSVINSMILKTFFLWQSKKHLRHLYFRKVYYIPILLSSRFAVSWMTYWIICTEVHSTVLFTFGAVTKILTVFLNLHQ